MKIIEKYCLKKPFSKARWLTSVCQGYRKCHKGVAAIEFAFVAPVMIFMYFGLAEISLAISADRKVSHSANVAGDLATQATDLSPDQMAEIMTATMMVMDIPENKRDQVNMEIASFSKIDDGSEDGEVVERGVATYNGTYPGGDFDATTLDDRILSPSSGIVVARITYNYTPLKFHFLNEDIKLKETFYLKPRRSVNVDILDSADTFNGFDCEYENGKVEC